MDSTQFDYVMELVNSRIGVIIKPGQRYLVESRLMPLARCLGVDSVAGVIEKAQESGGRKVKGMIVDAMTTNETMFYRDRAPFEHLRKMVFPSLIEEGGRSIRIWCAACSTGQEPYSLAMMFDQNPDLLGGVSVEIVATDVSEVALSQAREGLYNQFEVQRGLPLCLLMQYFTQEGDRWRLSDSIREKVVFMSHNLMDVSSHLGWFNIVLCRNVLIYFDREMKKKVLDKLAAQMSAGGYLLLGSAESALGLTSVFKEFTEVQGLYKRVAAASLASGEAA